MLGRFAGLLLLMVAGTNGLSSAVCRWPLLLIVLSIINIIPTMFMIIILYFLIRFRGAGVSGEIRMSGDNVQIWMEGEVNHQDHQDHHDHHDQGHDHHDRDPIIELCSLQSSPSPPRCLVWPPGLTGSMCTPAATWPTTARYPHPNNHRHLNYHRQKWSSGRRRPFQPTWEDSRSSNSWGELKQIRIDHWSMIKGCQVAFDWGDKMIIQGCCYHCFGFTHLDNEQRKCSVIVFFTPLILKISLHRVSRSTAHGDTEW